MPRPGILGIQPYKGGLSKAGGAKRVIKLSSNETPLGPSPKAIEAYKKEAEKLFRYPDGNATELRNAIGEVYNLNPERIICGAGSDEIISMLCLAYAGEGDEVLHTEHGFLMYPISSMAVGAKPVSVREKNLTTDVDALLAAVTGRTRIVFIANPNNPTGTYIPRDEVIRLRKNLPNDVLLVLDGAYAEYVEAADYTAGADIVDMSNNTVMTRTFSKIYGLAALRIGWSYCPPEIADILNRVRGPFNVSSPAISAGIAAVRDVEFVEKARKYNTVNLAWLTSEIAKLGFKVYPSVGNFFLVEFPDSEKANAYLMSEGIIARQVTNYGLGKCLRFTVGKEEENQEVVRVLAEFKSQKNL